MNKERWLFYLDAKNRMDNLSVNDAHHIMLDMDLNDNELLEVIKYFRSIYWNIEV